MSVQKPSACPLSGPGLPRVNTASPLSRALDVLLNHLVHRLSQALHVARVDARHADAPVARHVDGVACGHLVHHLPAHARVRKHADLRGHVRPGPAAALRLHVLAQQRAHADDAVSHALDLLVPLRLELLVLEHRAHDQGAVQGRVGVHGARDALHLALHRARLLGAVGDQRERAHALPVQPHVLGVRLAAAQAVPVSQEDADGLRVALAVARRKALVRHVEEGEVALVAHEAGDLAPLLRGGVHARGVVRARMQQEHRPAGRGHDVLAQPVKVQAARLRLVVPVRGLRHARVRPDVVVVGPGGHGDVDLGLGHVPLLEVCKQAAGSRARQRLHRGHLARRHHGRRLAVRQLDALGHKVLEAADG
eukprot:CAMPEP_0202857014 /NCGR_PEP_ID=MMETSP1391-20130828/107_1 /ASSEMBLY_ACC=CAM_ASM_000867 /TAXON_ID=1034604 /ORGANISM="Chlamydomonas leiostraca, Strain SAG 11-49" /LENGTH=364 /DNA_ID=CAMNT_0049535757 /DNA_START=1505 /DNA_END=2599 /DNA_ORIENTATION=+